MNKLILLLLLATAQASALAAEGQVQLDKLAATLRYLRAMPPGAKSALRCPSNLEKVHGTSMATVIATIGKPDYVGSREYTYFLSSPIPAGQKGGGHPEITFFTTKGGIVNLVNCTYAK
ncbi:MAG: hypothetical protein V4631_01380 [Pseudomonadota bacterium]